jgi:vancomycin resistance protein YoaR
VSAIRKVSAALVVGSTCLAAGALVAGARALPSGGVARGLFVGGRVPPRDGLGAWLDARRESLGARSVVLAANGFARDTTLAELGVALDVAETMRAARAVGRTGTLRERWSDLERASHGALDVPLAWRFDRARARAALETIAASVRREPVDARLDLDLHARIADVPGAELDVEATLDSIAAAPHDDGDAVALVLRAVPARLTADALAAVDVSKIVSSFETRFSLAGEGAGRAVNIARAAAKLDGLVLAPGETFSFNDVVGPRTLEAGFTHAPEIVGDEMQDGVGGGTCQVASTLHAAAVFGALDVVERHAHGRPSSYTKLGLDATVSYPTTDLRIHNPLPFPVLVHAFLPRATAVRVELLGGDPIARVDYFFGVDRSDDFVRRITVRPWLKPGAFYRKQKGIRGYLVSSWAKTTWADGRTELRHWSSDYRPTPEVFWVGPGVDDGMLPTLPEGAKGIEGRAATARTETGTTSVGL